MKQPKMEITDINGKHWGQKKIMSLNWSSDGKLVSAGVNFMNFRHSSDLAIFYDYIGNGEFINTHKNLKGTIIFE